MVKVNTHYQRVMCNIKEKTYMTLIEIPNGSLKQYYYDVIKRLYDVGLGDISTTEDFYYKVQHCFEIMLNVNECVDYLIEIKEKTNERIR